VQRVVEVARELAEAGGRVDRHRDDAGAQGAEEREHEVGVVGQDERDAVALLQAERLERAAEASARPLDARVGEERLGRLLLVEEAVARLRALGGLFDRLDDRARREGRAHSPSRPSFSSRVVDRLRHVADRIDVAQRLVRDVELELVLEVSDDLHHTEGVDPQVGDELARLVEGRAGLYVGLEDQDDLVAHSLSRPGHGARVLAELSAREEVCRPLRRPLACRRIGPCPCLATAKTAPRSCGGERRS
jgi:hypothetical protein